MCFVPTYRNPGSLLMGRAGPSARQTDAVSPDCPGHDICVAHLPQCPAAKAAGDSKRPLFALREFDAVGDAGSAVSAFEVADQQLTIFSRVDEFEVAASALVAFENRSRVFGFRRSILQ